MEGHLSGTTGTVLLCLLFGLIIITAVPWFTQVLPNIFFNRRIIPWGEP